MTTLSVSKTRSWQKLIFNKIFICTLLSFFAALGTLSYGYNFPKYFTIANTTVAVSLGIVCAACAMLANMMLGTYSLLHMKNGDSINNHTLLISFLGSIPYGFLCYFGYQNILTFSINVTISVIVVIVNTGIGYTAIKTLFASASNTLKNPPSKKKLFSLEYLLRTIGFIIGLAISSITYLAASSGATDLLIHYNQVTLLHYHVGFILAIISWIPCAALFANANQIVAGELYLKVSQFRKFVSGINTNTMLFFLFWLCSGAAIAQMTAESFSPAKQIPLIFKDEVIQFIVQHYLIITAMFSSAALNYFSINKLVLHIKK
jgi:hypothetical protein